MLRAPAEDVPAVVGREGGVDGHQGLAAEAGGEVGALLGRLLQVAHCSDVSEDLWGVSTVSLNGLTMAG